MSTYSTWLVFIKETTTIESFFKGVNVSIDSTFLVAQPMFSSTRREIKCVYRIEMSDLQMKKFATWTRGSGLEEFTNILDDKIKDFHGKIMRIGVYATSSPVYYIEFSEKYQVTFRYCLNEKYKSFCFKSCRNLQKTTL